jgi:hypothetical protein
MSCKGQFFLHGEDANTDSAFPFDCGVSREYESCLGEIGLASQGLHLPGTEASTVKENRQRIARQRPLGEHIDLHHRPTDKGTPLFRSRHA